MELAAAKKIVIDICYKLQPYCDKINIAGSIRRGKSEVKDAEIVCQPKLVESGQADLFGAGKMDMIPHDGFYQEVYGLGKIIKGMMTGKYMQIQLQNDFKLDLFMPDSFDYYRQYAIRTGSADYVAKVIAGGWKKKGWCGSDKGLRKIGDCLETKTPDGKSKWKCINENAELPPVWENETDFFKWLGVDFLPPQARKI